MATSTMKRVITKDFGMSSRVVQEKTVLIIDACKKRPQKGQTVVPEVEEGGLRQSPPLFRMKNSLLLISWSTAATADT
jgi:hypothetical protein